MIFFYALLAIMAPYALYALAKPNRKVTFEGGVPICTVGLLGKSALADGYDYLTAIMPDGSTLVFEETRERIATLSSPAVTAHITVTKTLLGKPAVSNVTWPGDSKPTASGRSNRAVYLGVAYLIIGLLALVFFNEPAQTAQIGYIGTVYAGLVLTLSGWIFGAFQMKPLPSDAESRILGISLGKGPSSFRLMTLVAIAATIGCFYAGGILFLLGINTAISAGMMLGLLFKPAAKS